MKRFLARGGRDHLWAFLDLLDARPMLKKWLFFGIPTVVVAVGFGVWGYERWSRTNAIRIARQWLEADRLDRAGIAIRDALENEPELPASWRLASDLAWRKGNKAASVEYAKKAAIVSRYADDEVLAWAEASLLSDDDQQAAQAMGFLDPAASQSLARALRVSGELARRGGRFSEARGRFQAALELDEKTGSQALAVDEVPLGIACLQTGSSDDRARGMALLAKWAGSAEWGIGADRALLADAVAHNDSAAIVLWAESLRKHPRCTMGDIPVCLKALAATAPARFQAMLAPLQEASRTVPVEAAQVLGWLNQIGQSQEAARWGQTLDPALSLKPPVAQGVAEALRATQRWAGLQAWVDKADWGRDLEFLGWAYGMVAARHLGNDAKADSLWKSLDAEGGRSPAHALFMGDSLYAWGYPTESARLL
jgi:tetratricopeptide (TPR) repeat protein